MMSSYVLLVDDDNFIGKVIQDSLGNAGLEVICVPDSGQAMEQIYKQAPSLILLDVELPDKNGYEVLRVLRNDTRTSHLPIIMVTARDSVKDRVEGLDAGADDYLVKPFAPAELVARVKSLLRRAHNERAYNPLTELPGNKLIQEEMERVITSDDKAVIYVDIDNFKAYNDTYGFIRGDQVILILADILKQCMLKYEPGAFLGHVGGDDFILITGKATAKMIGSRIIKQFSRIIPLAYDRKHREQGYIETNNRLGQLQRYDIMSLSVAILLINRGTAVFDISRSAAKLKHAAKLRQGNALLVETI